MRNFWKVAILLLLLLNACNLPLPETASPQETETPNSDDSYSACGFVWAREPLYELTQKFNEALKEVQPQANGYAEAYGENCINSQGELVRFLAMETDFHVSLKVEDLNDKQENGKLVEQILDVISEFPVAETPGPQPGYVGVTFESGGEEIQLWFTQLQAQTAIENGLQGGELFDALQ
jgi:hypothetical protein